MRLVWCGILVAAVALGQWTAEQDHRQMMDQLGIQEVRKGPSGNESDPNHANYDESKARLYGDLPDVLTFNNGQKVTTAAQWPQRRAEIVEDFEREVLGRVPTGLPAVQWRVESTSSSAFALERQLVGTMGDVKIAMTLGIPKSAKAPVPVMLQFTSSALRKYFEAHPEWRKSLGPDPPWTEQLIANGWGWAQLDTSSIQADNGAGLRQGVIGFANHGEPRKPDDWGSLRAWAWGASRALDYLETDKAVDAKRVGIEGVSRYGKAALVTMAFDTRFAVALLGSSGEGGVKPYRRNYGEAVENLTATGEYHWMAGNFIRYGAGKLDAGKLPVDSHELLALCAPRPVFVSYGIPEKGDSRWLDQQGSYMATVAAGAVWRLLGAKDLGVTEDYSTAPLPPVNTSVLDGTLAWRQHDWGHTDAPNWKYFIPWANRELGYHPAPMQKPAPDVPLFRTDAPSLEAHEKLLAKRAPGLDVYFEGDSITRRWAGADYPELLAHWTKAFSQWHAANFGWGGDRTQNILWRLEHGELDGVNPKVVVLLAGTNNLPDHASAADIARGLQAVVRKSREKAPTATVILMGVFPRHDDETYMPVIQDINAQLARLADGQTVRYLNINDKLEADGMLNAKDKLHLTVKAYEAWADALTPVLTEVMR